MYICIYIYMNYAFFNYQQSLPSFEHDLFRSGFPYNHLLYIVVSSEVITCILDM